LTVFLANVHSILDSSLKQVSLGEDVATCGARFLGEFVGGCGASGLHCALEPNGDIEPCVFIPLIVGNILRGDFVTLWHNHPSFKKIRDRKNFEGYCGTCEHRNLCGGCRARPYAYSVT
jgi:radical SAM protein with 4Fe4S-binding SPASM domain